MGNDKKTVRREGIALIKRVFTYVLNNTFFTTYQNGLNLQVFYINFFLNVSDNLYMVFLWISYSLNILNVKQCILISIKVFLN